MQGIGETDNTRELLERSGYLYPSIYLRCPRCSADVTGVDCGQCGLAFRICSGIIHALPFERAVHYARFAEEYERIRIAEGRSSENVEFYLSLPFKDVSGRNSRQWEFRSRTYECLLNQILGQRLSTGHILDLGAGNCWMSYRLSLAGYSPVAVDVLTSDRDGLGAARHYLRILTTAFPRFRAEYCRLPFRDNQFDAAIFNSSFHYAENYQRALSEALRCVKGGGLVVISETPWYSKASSGDQMVDERRAEFAKRYGTASDSIKSLEYLTDERLKDLAETLSIKWQIYSPRYGVQWAMRPIVAEVRGRREPARFRIYAAEKRVL